MPKLFFGGLPDDIRINILCLLLPTDLLMVSITSKMWLSLVRMDDVIWKPIVLVKLCNIKYNTTKESLLQRVQKLTTSELRKTLIRVDCLSCLEKSDYQIKAVAFLAFQEKIRRTSQNNYFTSRHLILPAWSHGIGEWKVNQ